MQRNLSEQKQQGTGPNLEIQSSQVEQPPGQDSPPAAAQEQFETNTLISGFVRDGSRSVEGARVLLTNIQTTGSIYGETRSDARGYFEFMVHHEGEYQLFASIESSLTTNAGFRSETIRVQAEDQEIGPLELQLVLGVWLRVEVVDENDGKPLAGATIGQEGLYFPPQPTRIDGSLSLLLPPGVITLVITAPGYELVHKTISLVKEKNNRLSVPLRSAGSVMGTIVDSQNQPVKDVIIEFKNSRMVHSNARGEYRLENVPFQPVRFYFLHKDFQSVTREITISPEAPEGILEVVMQRIPVPAYTTKDLRVTGRVSTKEGIPLAGARVGFVAYGLDINYKSVLTDKNGNFELTQQVRRESNMELRVLMEGYVPALIRIPPSQTEATIQVQLEPGITLDGMVLDEAGKPLSNVQIRIEHSTSRLEEVMTQADGSFHLNSMPVLFNLHFFKKAYAPVSIRAPAIDGSLLEVVLPGPRFIRGQVIDKSSGRPIEAFTISAIPVEKGMIVQNFNRWQDPGIEFDNSEGHFSLGPIYSESPFQMEVTAWGFVPVSLESVPSYRQGEGPLHIIDLEEKGIAIGGRVFSPEGQPLQNCKVLLLRFRGTRTAYRLPLLGQGSEMEAFVITEMTTGPDGLFRFEHQPEKALFDLVFIREGFADKILATIEAYPQEQQADLAVTLIPEAVIFGKVNAEKFKGPYSLTLVEKENGFWQQAELEVNDAFRFKGLAAGTYRLVALSVRATDGIYKTYTKNDLSLADGEQLEVNIGFEEHYKLSGQAQVNGLPMAGATLFLINTKEQFDLGRTVITDARGFFQFDEVTEGIYDLVPFNQGPGDELKYVARREHPIRERIEVFGDYHGIFNFPKTGNIRGRLSPLPSKPSVLLFRGFTLNGGPQIYRQANPDLDGQFKLVSLPPGEYNLYLTMYENSQNNMRVINERIIMPADGSDVDLGDLDPGQHGNLEIRIEGDIPEARYLNINLYDNPVSGDENLAATSVLTRGQTRQILSNLPIGTLWAKVGLPGPWMVSPSLTQVEIMPDQTSELVFLIQPTTAMTLLPAKGSIFSALSLEADQRVYKFESFDLMPTLLQGGDQPILWISPDLAMIRNLPSGTWLLHATNQKGQEIQAQIQLEPGKEGSLTLDFPSH